MYVESEHFLLSLNLITQMFASLLIWTIILPICIAIFNKEHKKQDYTYFLPILRQ